MNASFFHGIAGALMLLLASASPFAFAAKPAHYYFCVEHPNTKPRPEMTTIFVWVEPDNFKPHYWDYPRGWFHAREQKRYMPTSGNGWCRGGDTLAKVQEEWAKYYIQDAWTATSDDRWIKEGQRVRPDPLEDKQLLDRLVRKAKGQSEAAQAAAKAQAQAKPEAKGSSAPAGKSQGTLTIDDSYAKEQAKFRKEHEARMQAGAQRDAAAKAKADAATAELRVQQQREIATRKMMSRPCATPGCASKQ